MSITQLQSNQFDYLHEFHKERTQSILEDLCHKFGDAILDVASQQKIDRYGLYEWHTLRYVEFLENLKSHYGQEIIDQIVAKQMEKEEESGRACAAKWNHEFRSLVEHFTGGDSTRVVEETDEYVMIITDECYAGRIAYRHSKEALLYPHHCGLDQAFVKGFNEKIALEIPQTILQGADYCLHKIWKIKL